MEHSCYKCSAKLDIDDKSSVARSEECPKCFANLRCCMMCSFYDTNSYNDCREPTADRILEKEKANFCDHYKLGVPSDKKTELNDILAEANALFK